MADNYTHCLCLKREKLQESFSSKVSSVLMLITKKKILVFKKKTKVLCFCIQTKWDRVVAQRKKTMAEEERNAKQGILLERKKKTFRISGIE